MKDKMTINDINNLREPFVLAEIGLNHNRDTALACGMIDKAVECGAAGVKFQTYITDNLMTADNPAYSIFKDLELNVDQWKEIANHCHEIGTNFVSTPFCHETVDLLAGLGVNAYKIASCDITYLDLIAHVASLGLPIIISTGMSSMAEISNAVETCLRNNNSRITLLHCLSKYPPQDDDMNLTMISVLQKEFAECRIGLSDHTGDYLAAVVASSLGATFFEKHFTIDRNLPGPDQQISTDPQDFRQYVTAINRSKKMLAEKSLTDRADMCIAVPSRRSIFAKKHISKGERFTKDNLIGLRPGDGIEISKLDEIVGKIAGCDIPQGTKLTTDGIE